MNFQLYFAELKQIKSQLENGQIDKNEYKKCQKSILDAWVGKSSSNKTTKASNSNTSKDTSLYVVLQLDSNATNAEIRSNYKKLAKNYHPDKNNGIETPKISPELEIMNQTDKKKCRYNIRISQIVCHLRDKLSFTMAKSKKLNIEEINKMAWRLLQSEISSITHETCDNLLNCSHDEKSYLVNSLQLLDKVWIEVGKACH
ncbi:hypothetical protein C2G38_2200548 [Gigaspora rosea]|uniref:J domain-containing protein n=1 Tax=Gigaspora rosea TaxID=44941 RepID=A0A397UZ31_9GLOM|nr:hypothetical protein C2G38_2200548 [Gigaspora rosea]